MYTPLKCVLCGVPSPSRLASWLVPAARCLTREALTAVLTHVCGKCWSLASRASATRVRCVLEASRTSTTGPASWWRLSADTAHMDGHDGGDTPTSPGATSMLQRLHQERLERQRARAAHGSGAAASAGTPVAGSTRAAAATSDDAGTGGGTAAADSLPPFPTRAPVWLDNGDVPPPRPAPALEPAPTGQGGGAGTRAVPAAAAAASDSAGGSAGAAAVASAAAVVARPVKPTSEEDWDDFACAVCLKLLLEPVAVRCGHTFCRRCLKRALQFNVRGTCAAQGATGGMLRGGAMVLTPRPSLVWCQCRPNAPCVGPPLNPALPHKR